MALLTISLLLAAKTFALVWPAVAGVPAMPFAAPDRRAALLTLPILVVIAAGFGPGFALATVMALLLQEFGQVLGHRLTGNWDARLRPIPVPGAAPATGRVPAHDLAELVVLMTGVGLGLAPMVFGFALGNALAETAPALAQAAWSFALATGAVNAISLLPFWPLPGGRIFTLLLRPHLPRQTGRALAASSAFILGLALTMHSPLLAAFSLLALMALQFRPYQPPKRPPLKGNEFVLGLAAYGTTFAAFLCGGWWAFAPAM